MWRLIAISALALVQEEVAGVSHVVHHRHDHVTGGLPVVSDQLLALAKANNENSKNIKDVMQHFYDTKGNTRGSLVESSSKTSSSTVKSSSKKMIDSSKAEKWSSVAKKIDFALGSDRDGELTISLSEKLELPKELQKRVDMKKEKPFDMGLSAVLRQNSGKVELLKQNCTDVQATKSSKEEGESRENELLLACMSWKDTIDKTGWAQLTAKIPEEAGQAFPELAMYMVGYLEGALSTKRITHFQDNANIAIEKSEPEHHALGNIQIMFRAKLRNIVRKFTPDATSSTSESDSDRKLQEEQLFEDGAIMPQDETVSLKDMIDLKKQNEKVNDSTKSEDAIFWEHSRYMLFQSLGIRDGFNARKAHNTKTMSLIDLMVLSSDGETPELQTAYDMQEYLMRQDEQNTPTADTSDEETFEDDTKSEETKSTDSTKDSDLDDAKSSFLQRRSLISRNLIEDHHRNERQARKDKYHQVRLLKQGITTRHKSLFKNAEKHLKVKQEKIVARQKNFKLLNEKRWRTIQRRGGRCSALIRLVDDNVFFGHTTFSDYSEMIRVLKSYDFSLPNAASSKITFSSYPGIAGSTDDYYLTNSGLAVTETTISLLSDEPYDHIDDNFGIPDYMRILLATRLAHSGEQWMRIMHDSATGTYSSQWMVVDTNKIEKKKDTNKKHSKKTNKHSNNEKISLLPGFFYVMDQAPNSQHYEDMTSWLQKNKYWGSENRAWFEDVREKIGATAAEIHGPMFSRDHGPRANIFRATAPAVMTLQDMKKEMQSNRWPHEVDGGSRNSPDHAIAARSDIDPVVQFPNGAVDSKVADIAMINRQEFFAISGPTTDSGRLKPFTWRDDHGVELYPDSPHEGQPTKWNFPWIHFGP